VTPAAGSEPRVVWAFWIAAALAALGGIAPLVVGGGTNRITGVVFPFAVAAIAFGACAVLYRQQGRPIITLLYVVAGIAIVYGILSMISVPLELAVVGTCPPAPATCPIGNERGLTSAEMSGLGFATGIGIVAILTGFYGLTVLFRSYRMPPPSSPPARRIAPVSSRAPLENEPAEATAAPSAEPELELPKSAGQRTPKPASDSPPAGNKGA
jgi:hypothetical protein